VIYTAAPGEVNQPTVTFDAMGLVVTVTDPATTLTATAPCSAVDTHTVRCEVTVEDADDRGSLDSARVDLGDLDDTLTSASPRPLATQIFAGGGTGDDALTSATGGDILQGGSGVDTLVGGPGSDTLVDNDEKGALDHDVLDGGAGSDTVGYSAHTAPVTAALDGSGGDDTLVNIERVFGGSGDDVLTGDDGKQTLSGNDGDDTLVALGGNDTVAGGRGNDDLQAGAGDDTLDAGYGGTDIITCDDGTDLVLDPSPPVIVGDDCEGLRFFDEPSLRTGRDGITFRPTPTDTTGAAATFSLHCPLSSYFDFGEANPCKGRITLRELGGSHRLVGVAKFHNRGTGRDFPVRVKLTKAGRKLVRAADGAVVGARLRGQASSPTSDDGGFPDARWALRLT
jgi:Ca2+-binding RTX toxin-like protein